MYIYIYMCACTMSEFLLIDLKSLFLFVFFFRRKMELVATIFLALLGIAGCQTNNLPDIIGNPAGFLVRELTVKVSELADQVEKLQEEIRVLKEG